MGPGLDLRQVFPAALGPCSTNGRDDLRAQADEGSATGTLGPWWPEGIGPSGKPRTLPAGDLAPGHDSIRGGTFPAGVAGQGKSLGPGPCP